MDYLHIKNLEKYHPGYKDRTLLWAKIYFNTVQGDPDCEMITDEIDWARLIKFIILELQAKRPIPLDDAYLIKKGFNLKKRPIALTLKMLHNFIEVVTQLSSERAIDIDKDIDKEESRIDIEVVTQPTVTNAHPLNLFILENCKIVSKLKTQMTDSNCSDLVNRFGEQSVKDILLAMENYKDTTKKYNSVYLTAKNWLEKREKDGTIKPTLKPKFARCEGCGDEMLESRIYGHWAICKKMVKASPEVRDEIKSLSKKWSGK